MGAFDFSLFLNIFAITASITSIAASIVTMLSCNKQRKESLEKAEKQSNFLKLDKKYRYQLKLLWLTLLYLLLLSITLRGVYSTGNMKFVVVIHQNMRIVEVDTEKDRSYQL